MVFLSSLEGVGKPPSLSRRGGRGKLAWGLRVGKSHWISMVCEWVNGGAHTHTFD